MSITANKLPTIRQLPPNLVNQIAAGEVIERPASVVKELLENAIDAGSGRIEVTIKGGGSELIRISDDGCGMTSDQLPLAVTSHATSKLPDDASLFHVGTLGFRGEALASIGSVSQLTIRSRTEGEQAGSEMVVRGGVIESPAPSGCPVGTVIEVRKLFFNTPVRRKFLKTDQTERGHIVEAFTRLALANPKVHFVLRNGDKQMFDLPATTRWSDRIEAFFGGEVAEALIPIRNDDSQVRITGYACDPSVSRGNNRMQYLFLNGRHIRDRALQHALGEAYRGLLMVGRLPICFLRIEMPPEMIDVNVHPAKLEVRFTDSGRIYSRLLQSLRHHFLTTDMTQRVGPAEPMSAAEIRSEPTESALGMRGDHEQRHRQDVMEWARTGSTSAATRAATLSAVTPETVTTSPGQQDAGGGVGGDAPLPALPTSGVPGFKPFVDTGAAFAAAPASPTPGGTASAGSEPATQDSRSPDAEAPWESPSGHSESTMPTVCYLGFQVHNRYLVTQDEKGMVIIDQHALHERVLYERVCTKVLGEDHALESQRLLVPEPVSLTPTERSAALDARKTFAKVGLEIDDFGGETVVIQAYPAMLPNIPPGEMLRTCLEPLMAAGKAPDPQDLLNHLLSTIACKAAVKAGDPLSPEEVVSLLEQKDLYDDTHHCPHGRPTSLFFSLDELDRMFGRMGARGKV